MLSSQDFPREPIIQESTLNPETKTKTIVLFGIFPHDCALCVHSMGMLLHTEKHGLLGGLLR